MDKIKAPLLPLRSADDPDAASSRPQPKFFIPSSFVTLHNLSLALGPFASALVILTLSIDGPNGATSRYMLAAMAWIFAWWLTEAVPLPITSLAPLYLFPALGLASADTVAKSYMNDVIALVLGSFILAIAVEHYNIHQRLALNITLLFCGGDAPSPHMLLLGICATTAFISFWMQNTAAAVMMVPVAMGILQRLPRAKSNAAADPTRSTSGNDADEADEHVVAAADRFAKAVVLGVTYAAAVGGIATLTGTGVNMITAGMWASYYPDETPISFSSWFMFGFPLALVIFLALWAILCFLYLSKDTRHVLAVYLDRCHLQRELDKLGPMAFAEKMVLCVFGSLVVLWMTRSITDDIPGWGTLFKTPVGDGTVSVMMATLLFIIPNMNKPGEKLMDWTKCKKLQWDVILLLGAGFAIADGVRTSGLADLLSASLVFLRDVPYLAVAPLVCLVSATITEFASNNATATLVIPLLIQLAKTIGTHPLLLMIPGAIGAEFAYWLPTGTPSNIVGFATGRLSIRDMVKVGVPLKIVGIAVLGLLAPSLGVFVFRIGNLAV